MIDKNEKMKEIKDELISFSISPLYDYRIQNNNFPVIGEGSHDADIMFIGEAPGKNEAKTGKPFCGRSGQILDLLLASIDLPRESVYVTNVVKDRPPENRDPTSTEIELYGPFLDRQISIIKPKVIATLGRFSMTYIMNKFGLGDHLSPISVLHGKAFKVERLEGNFFIIPLYHPAVAVYNSKKLDTLKDDFKEIAKYARLT